MSFNFPASPTVGQAFPVTPIAGTPQYRWDGVAWVVVPYDPFAFVARAGDTMTGPLVLPADPATALQAATKQYVDAAKGANSPLEALAFSGMQINGSMEVVQEFGYEAQSIVSGTALADGWKIFKSGTMAFAGGSSFSVRIVPGINCSLFAVITTAQPTLGAVDYTVVQQLIEGFRIARLEWGNASARPMTIGFWSQHNRVGLYSVAISNPDATRSYVAMYTQAVSNTPQWNTVVIPGCPDGTWPRDAGIGMALTFSMGSGSTLTAPIANAWLTGSFQAGPGQVNAVAATSDAFRITGVVMLPGSHVITALQSPFLMRPFAFELLECQRYFYKRTANVFGYNVASAVVGQWFPHPVEMRAFPTMTLLAGGTYTNVSNLIMDQANTKGYRVYCTMIATGTGAADGFNITASARL